jgi:transposase
MAARRSPLPDLKTLDADVLRTMLEAAHAELDSAQEQLLSRDHEIEHLKFQLAKLRHLLFGRSSEKVRQQIEQLELRLEELETARAEHMRTPSRPPAEPGPEAAPRRSLPDHLPREVEMHVPAHEACPECGGRDSLISNKHSGALPQPPHSP